MKKAGLRLSAILVAVIFCSSLALCWAPGTHAYIASTVNVRPGMMNNQIYAATAADVDAFYTALPDYNEVIFPATHYQSMLLWKAASGRLEKSLALGFVSHNERWGADHTAHISSFTFGKDKGYVIVKSQQLCDRLLSELNYLGMGDYAGLIDPMKCHFVLEYGIDLLMVNKHPGLGFRLYQAAANRDPALDTLLMKAYPSPLGAMFAGAEPQWQAMMKQYAQVLMLPADQRVDAMAQFLTQLAMAMGVLPSVTDPAQVAALTGLIKLAIVDSMDLCKKDFNFEIEATRLMVGYNLWVKRVRY